MPVTVRIHSARYKSTLKKNGVKVVSATGVIFEGAEGIIKAPARHKAEDDYLLTTKLFCGHCGAYLCGESGTSRTMKVRHYYKFVNAKKKKACKKKRVKKSWIEDLVIDETMKIVMDDKAIEAIVSMVMDLQERECTSHRFTN